MLLKLDEELLNMKGEQLKDQADAVVTLRNVCVNSVLGDYGEQLRMRDKYKRFKLAQKLEAAPAEGVEITASDAKLIEELIAKAYPPIIAGQAYELIEGIAASSEDEE